MKQYNRIMLGEHSKYISDCLKNNYIGVNFVPNYNLANRPHNDETQWRNFLINEYLQYNADKSKQTARKSIGFLWTICFGLKIGDIILASNGEGSYHVGEISSDYYFLPNTNLPHRRAVKWKNIVISRQNMSEQLQHSSGSIGTCCNITKYAEELENLIKEGTPRNDTSQQHPKIEKYKERSLHRLLSNYLLKRNILSKTIFHETSGSKDPAQKWIHPDMVGVEFNEFRDSVTLSLLKTTDAKQYITFYSYELKRTIENDHQLKEYFFQALSNSSWANYGYLVALEINEDVMEEMERLNRAFGIGVIKLSPYTNETDILFPAKKNELDYYTIDKLCNINKDFENFIKQSTNILTVGTNVLEAVKVSLQNFCDKGFSSDDDLLTYCKNNNIPC